VMVSYAEDVGTWYDTLGRALAGDFPVPSPAPADPADEGHRLACLRHAAATGGGQDEHADHRLHLLWIRQLLDELRELEAKLVQPAVHVRQASQRRGRAQALPRGFRSSPS
jgi:hypothetical protein